MTLSYTLFTYNIPHKVLLNHSYPISLSIPTIITFLVSLSNTMRFAALPSGLLNTQYIYLPSLHHVCHGQKSPFSVTVPLLKVPILKSTLLSFLYSLCLCTTVRLKGKKQTNKSASSPFTNSSPSSASRSTA